MFLFIDGLRPEFSQKGNVRQDITITVQLLLHRKRTLRSLSSAIFLSFSSLLTSRTELLLSRQRNSTLYTNRNTDRLTGAWACAPLVYRI